jgi:hypothetical protein
MAKATRDIQKIFAEGSLIDEAMRKAAREALRIHKRAGHPLAIWRDGRVQWISPEEFERGLLPTALA